MGPTIISQDDVDRN